MSAAPSPTVSVVIPAYNATDFVGGAVESALSQTRPPLEVVCVDDGSEDDTLSYLHRLADLHPGRVRVVAQANGGPSSARNRGLAEVTSDYVQFLDADDELDRDKFECQIALALEASDPPDLIVSGYRRLAMDGDEVSTVPIADDVWTGLATSRLGITSANLCRTDAVRTIHGWREDLLTSEDPDLYFRLLASGARVLLDPHPRATLRRRPDSQWNQDERRSLEGWVVFRGRLWEHLREHGLDTSERQRALEVASFRTLERLASVEGVGREGGVALLKASGLPTFPHARKQAYQLLFKAFGYEKAEALMDVYRSVRGAVGR